MKWHLKVFAYQVLSTLPGGSALYRLSQEKLTRSLVPTRSRIEQKIKVGLQYAGWLKQHGMLNLLMAGSHLDLGAGWHPTIPLAYYAMGTKRQYLFDVEPVMSQELIEQTVKVFLEVANDPSLPYREQMNRLPPPMQNEDGRKYLEKLGIHYHAPYADVFPKLAGQIDVATSTQVLLHIPREPLAWCFQEIHKSLKPGGVFLATIHLRDILVGATRNSSSAFHQLRYSPATWERWFNSSIMSFNRLRAPDYRELLEKAGFELRHFEVEPATPEELVMLDQVKIDPFFSRYTREDLGARHLFFAAQKR